MNDEVFELEIARMFAGRFTVVGDCWEFNGRREGGYGRITLGGRRGQQVLVHRHVLGLRLGRPVKSKALHTCDNPPCFRPHHIYEGTQQQNADDRSARGRTAAGELNGRAHLTESSVRQLRVDRGLGFSYQQLAVKYGVTKATARSAALRQTWKEVA